MWFDYGRIEHFYKNWWSGPSMYEIGKFFLSHKMVVRRCLKKKGKRR